MDPPWVGFKGGGGGVVPESWGNIFGNLPYGGEVSILAPKYILGQVRSCNLLGRRAGQGSNKRLIQAEICLDIPPGAAFGGAPRALRALGRGDI